MLFEKLKVWRDEQSRSGPENMAVDEWLMKSVGDTAVLRLYLWIGDWVSLGYFQSLTDALKIFGEGPEYVRR
jgi:lipoate-protein ligase A